MKKLFDFIFVTLLLVYPFINMIPNDITIFGKLWAALATIFVFTFILLKLHAINRYIISGFIIFLFAFISILLSNELNFLKILTAYKYALPLLLASYIYWYPLDEKRLNTIYKITFLYIILMLILATYRLSLINFNLLLVTLYKDFVWYEKSHNFAQMYILLSIGFLYLSYLLKKNLYLAYMFFIPIFFIGVRSVMMGAILFLAVLSIPIIKRNFLKFILLLAISISSLIVIQPNFSKLTPLFLSAQDATRGTDKADLSSISSGRDIILNYYIEHLDSERIFIGSGLQYLEKNATFIFGLHNDTLEFFFSFGLFGFFSFLFAIYYNIFYNAYKNTKGFDKYFIVGIIMLFLSISSFAFFLYNQIIIYLFILVYIIKNNKIKY